MPNRNYTAGRALEYKVNGPDLQGAGRAQDGWEPWKPTLWLPPQGASVMGLVDILTPKEMVDLVLDGWQRLHDDKVLGTSIPGGEG